jgi:hypothetical protein
MYFFGLFNRRHKNRSWFSQNVRRKIKIIFFEESFLLLAILLIYKWGFGVFIFWEGDGVGKNAKRWWRGFIWI